MEPPEREIRVAEPRAVPWLSVLFGYAAMLPPVVAAAAAWFGPEFSAVLLTDLSILYGGALLAFLAGVRRGLSFRTPQGPTRTEIATVLFIAGLAGAALFSTLVPARATALGLLMFGHASLAVLDTIAARRGEAPLFFARLRPGQMPIAAAAYAMLLLHEA